MGRRAQRSRLGAWRAFLVAHALLVRRLDHELREEIGIPLSWYDVLFTLSDAGDGGRLRMHDLAERVLITRSNCTRLVDRMARHGLVRREADPRDRRGVVAVLTDDGRNMLRRAAQVHLRGVTEHWAAHLSREDADRLERVFDDIAAALRRQPALPADLPDE
jgi:DNA-binding MarR family transcriptional regulator